MRLGGGRRHGCSDSRQWEYSDTQSATKQAVRMRWLGLSLKKHCDFKASIVVLNVWAPFYLYSMVGSFVRNVNSDRVGSASTDDRRMKSH